MSVSETIFERHSLAVFQLEWIDGMSLSKCISGCVVTVAQRRKESYHLPRFDVHLSTFINKSLSVLLPIGRQNSLVKIGTGSFYNSKYFVSLSFYIRNFRHVFLQISLRNDRFHIGECFGRFQCITLAQLGKTPLFIQIFL